MHNTDAIGVFDSGLGGISVLKELKNTMPNENFIYFGDSHFAPYGNKTKFEVLNRCEEICEWFTLKHVKCIIIACNTATSAAVNPLREKYVIPIIGMEPALKMAANGKENQNILVLATKLTLKEKKFADLLSHYDQNNNIYKIPCPELVKIVEKNQIKNDEIVGKQFEEYFKDIDMNTVDSIVLGCTHFVFFKDFLERTYPNITIYDGNKGTANHVYNILKENDSLNPQTEEGTVKIYNSSSDEYFLNLSKLLFEGE